MLSKKQLTDSLTHYVTKSVLKPLCHSQQTNQMVTVAACLPLKKEYLSKASKLAKLMHRDSPHDAGKAAMLSSQHHKAASVLAWLCKASRPYMA